MTIANKGIRRIHEHDLTYLRGSGKMFISRRIVFLDLFFTFVMMLFIIFFILYSDHRIEVYKKLIETRVEVDKVNILSDYIRTVADSLKIKISEDNIYIMSVKIIDNSSQRVIPDSIIVGVIETESDFVSSAYNDIYGATGLMQILPPTARLCAKELGMRHYDLKNPQDNIDIGCYYLSNCVSYYGDFTKAINLYGGVARKRVSDTTEYYLEVTKNAKKYMKYYRERLKIKKDGLGAIYGT